MKQTSILEQSVNYLRGLLACGPVLATEAYAACARAGHRRATVRRAKRRLRVASHRRLPSGDVHTEAEYRRQPWVWVLPDFPTRCKKDHLFDKPILSGGTLVGRFIAENLVVHPMQTISAADLRSLFISWCQAEGLSEDDLPWSKLGKVLADFGCVSRNLIWYGIGQRR